jgi:hypothetical protein
MTVEKQKAIVEALAKQETTELEKLVNALGGSQQVFDFYTDVWRTFANNDPLKIKAGSLFLMGLQKALERIERQKQGEKILSQL